MASGRIDKLVFVRQRNTLRFVDRRGKWVVSFDDAAKFRSTSEACDFCTKKSVQKAEIVMRMGEPIYDVTISLH